MSQSKGSRGGKRAPATWRTNDTFGVSQVVVSGSPITEVIVGVQPQNPVAIGSPEPITAYDVLAVEGGYEIQQLAVSGLLTSPVQFVLAFGVYKALWDNSTGAWVTQDPLNATHVCQDNWLHLEWRTYTGGPNTGATGAALFPLNGYAYGGRHFRFSSAKGRIREGQALIGVMSTNLPVGGVLALGVLPYFRYLIRMAA